MNNKYFQEKITILIPTFKRKNKLRIAIESCLNQKYKNIELIISDNCSNDGTVELLEELSNQDSRIKYFTQKTNIGMNGNFNFLVKQVKTNLFCMLTDDDYYKDTFLVESVGLLEDNPSASFVALECPAIDENKNIIKKQFDMWAREGYFEKKSAPLMYLSGNHPIIITTLFKAEVLKDFNFDEIYGAVSDIPLLANLSSKYNFLISKKIGGHFIRHQHIYSNEVNLNAKFLLSAFKILQCKKINEVSKSSILKIRFVESLKVIYYAPYIDGEIYSNVSSDFSLVTRCLVRMHLLLANIDIFKILTAKIKSTYIKYYIKKY